MDDASLNDAPPFVNESTGAVTAGRLRLESDVLFWGFVSAASFSLSIYVAANLYARWHDPWMTPRLSQPMMLWRNFGGVMGRVMLLSLPFGIPLCFAASTFRKRMVAGLLTALIIVVPLILGLPV